MAQARAVAAAIDAPTELVAVTTRGDRIRRPLTQVGGKGLFTVELGAALRRGEVHLAVHSAKDLPADMPEDMTIAAVPPREDSRDAVVSPGGAGLDELPGGANVGTSSLRRACQVGTRRPDVVLTPLRGNVQTRLRKLRQGRYDAVVLAMAGLKRLGLIGRLGTMVRPLAVTEFVPAAGQGALAVQCLSADGPTREALGPVGDPTSAAALSAERMVIRRLGATCRSAVGVHLRVEGAGWQALGIVGRGEGTEIIRLAAAGPTPQAAAEALLAALVEAGAGELLA